MSAVDIVVIAVVVVILLLVVGGTVASRRRATHRDFPRDVAKADRALEAARAADRGWDRELLDRAARAALAERHPDDQWHTLELVLVDDRPGVAEDRAHMRAVGVDKSVDVVLARDGEGRWSAERLADPLQR